MSVDNFLRKLIFQKFRLGTCEFDFLEVLLAVCITGVAYLLRTPFETGLPHWLYLLAEWAMAVCGAVLTHRYGGSRMKTIGTYAILMILPTVVADGTILRSNASVGALLLICGLLLLQEERRWLFTAVTAFLLLWSVKYIGLLFACMVLWQNRKLRSEQLLILLAAGCARFFLAYRAWLSAGYSLVTFHWPNIYEIVGKASVQGQLIDPIALVGLFLALGLLVMAVWLFAQGKRSWETVMEPAVLLRLLLFFGLAAGYFLPYMDQSCGYLYCILGVLYVMLVPEEFPVPMLLQIVTFAGYQECFNGESMMPMAVFSVIQFLFMAWLGVQLLQEAGVIPIWKIRN